MNKSNHTPLPKLELGTHPANHRLNIIKPLLFGSNVTVLPECEGGHVSIKNKEWAEKVVHRVNNWDKLVEALEIGRKSAGFLITLEGFSAITESMFREDLKAIEAALSLAKEGI